MRFLRRFLKNKVLVLSICVIVVSLVYMGVQKAIDNYNYKENNDIVFGNDIVDDSNSINQSENQDISKGGEEFLNEEIDLVLEETEGKESANEAQQVDKEVEEQRKIYVYITGEVNNPGVVILNEGTRIVDAINAAGGTTVNANISKVNLVYILDDGMKINIPNNSDLKNNSDFEYITMNSGDGGKDDYSNKNADESHEQSSDSNKYNSMVNINTATQTELETLPGIGPSLALKIINFRKENGKFSSIEEIKNVSGIGDSKFENLKEYITI